MRETVEPRRKVAFLRLSVRYYNNKVALLLRLLLFCFGTEIAIFKMPIRMKQKQFFASAPSSIHSAFLQGGLFAELSYNLCNGAIFCAIKNLHVLLFCCKARLHICGIKTGCQEIAPTIMGVSRLAILS